MTKIVGDIHSVKLDLEKCWVTENAITKEFFPLGKLNRELGVLTIREEDGLAMSSRNLLLSDRARTWAPELHRAMEEMSEGLLAGGDLETLRAAAVSRVERAGFTQVEYLDLRSADQLELMTTPDRPARLLAAAWLAGVRLIDNIAVG